MKYTIYTFILTFFIVVSCKNEKSLEDLVKDKNFTEIEKRKADLQNKMNELDKQITEINTILDQFNPEGKIILVKTSQIKETLFNHYIEIQANVTTDQNVIIYPEFAGILNLYVHEGQRVQKGQIIGKINDGGVNQQLQQAKIGVTTIQAQLQQAQIQTDLAKSAFDKQSKLWAQKIGSEIQYLQAKTSYEASLKQISAIQTQISAAQQGVSAIQSTLAKTNIIAPFSGIIDKLITQNGQVVGPGIGIVKLISIDNMKVEAEVPEIYLSKINTQTKTLISIPAIKTDLVSKVSLVGEYVNPNNRTFKTTVHIPSNPLVKPNLIAKVQFNDYMNPNALVVPSNVIRIDAEGNKFVFKISNLKGNEAIAKKQIVTVGQANKSDTEILQGINPGDFIISEGYQKLVDGDKITIENK